MDREFRSLMANNFIRLLSIQGIFSENALKSLFRILSKKTHPDLNKGIDPELFRKLEREYREACDLLPLAKIYFVNGAVDPGMVRHYMYAALAYYTASGQHSFKVRNRQQLAVRNRLICEDVERWAGLYDVAFLQIFQRYNSFRFQDFMEWRSNRRFRLVRRYFLTGLSHACDVVCGSLPNPEGVGRAAVSFLKDAIFLIDLLERSDLSGSIRSFCCWLVDDLDVNRLKPI